VFNRGNDKRQLFPQTADYRRFLALLRDAPRACDNRLLAYCLMPNHWHLTVMPRDMGALSAYLQWVTGTHGQHWRRGHVPRVPGHVYQGRFRSVPILTDQHLLTTLRYVEANPVRAGLVSSAREWPWSSRSSRKTTEAPTTARWPWPVPQNWDAQLDAAQPDAQLNAVRRSLMRGVPMDDIEPPEEGTPVEASADAQPGLF
jgi:putative transposase